MLILITAAPGSFKSAMGATSQILGSLGNITKSPSAILKSLLCKAFKLSRIQASLTEYKTHHC